MYFTSKSCILVSTLNVYINTSSVHVSTIWKITAPVTAFLYIFFLWLYCIWFVFAETGCFWTHKLERSHFGLCVSVTNSLIVVLWILTLTVLACTLPKSNHWPCFSRSFNSSTARCFNDVCLLQPFPLVSIQMNWLIFLTVLALLFWTHLHLWGYRCWRKFRLC